MNLSYKLKTGVLLNLILDEPLHSNHKIKFESEFDVQPYNPVSDQSHIEIVISNDITYCASSLRTFKSPVCCDKDGVFFQDSLGHIARIYFHESDKVEIHMSGQFNINFYYIICLYFISLFSVQYNYAYVHASALFKDDQTLVFPAWRHAGKTSLSSKATEFGWTLLSDDGIYINPNLGIIPSNFNTQYVFHNYLNNSNLLDTLSSEYLQLFSDISSIQSINGISEELQSHLYSLFRVRVPISQRASHFHSKNLTVCYLAQKEYHSDIFNDSAMSQTRDYVLNLMYRSSHFELRYMFDLHDLYSALTGYSNSIIDNYEFIVKGIYSNFLSKSKVIISDPGEFYF